MPLASSIAFAPLLLSGSIAFGATAPSPSAETQAAPKVVVVKKGPDRAARPKACVSAADVASARKYARGRPGSVSFAVYEQGKLQSWGGGVSYRSASLVKAMLLVADLRRHDRLHAGLDAGARSRLSAMIRVSDNGQASATFNLVGAEAVRSVARLAGMRNYRVGGYWGTSQLTASDQARFFGRLNRLFPPKYRAYGRQLLRSVVPYQTWGGAPVARRHGFKTMFKSGWLPRTGGWVVHQGMRLERGRCTVGVAVLTGSQPSMAIGVESIRGVTERLL